MNRNSRRPRAFHPLLEPRPRLRHGQTTRIGLGFRIRGAVRAVWLVGLMVLLSTSAAAAQSLAQRVARAPDGVVRFGFAAKPGVWGDGRGFHFRRSTGEWESTCRCASDIIRVALSQADGRVTDVRTYVGGRWRPAGAGVTHIGRVGSIEAAGYLLELVPRLASEDAAEEAMLGAVLADRAVVWRRLLGLARERTLRQDVREKAIFWLGQAASEAATAGLETIVTANAEEREVREHAIFALSQRPPEQGVPALIRVVRTNPDPELKKKALFWLGQSGDPRALALFEEILTRR